MGIRTGNPRGRPIGAKNKRTRELEAATQLAAQALSETIPGAFEGDAHAFLMTIYKDPMQDLPLRIDAAKAAVRYEKPALATLDMTSVNTHTIRDVTDEPLNDAEWTEQHVTAH